MLKMKTAQLTVSVDAEKLSALRHYAAKKEVSIEAELTDAIDRLYEKLVPATVREYIESRANDPALARPSRPVRSKRKTIDPVAGV